MKNFFLLFFCLAVSFELWAQCTGCTISSSATSGTLTANAGQKICLTASGTFSGTITLYGDAQLCVSSATTFSGTLNAYNNNNTIQNYGTWTSSFNLFGSGNAFQNFGVFNIATMTIGTNNSFTSTTDVTLSGNLSLYTNATMTVSANLSINNYTGGNGSSLTVSGNLNSRDLTSDGTITVGGSTDARNITSNNAATFVFNGTTNVNNVRVNANSSISFNGQTTIARNVVNNSQLNFNAVTSVGGNVTLNNSSGSSQLNINGATSIDGNLTVNNGHLNINVNTSVGRNFTNNGPGTTTVTDATLSVSGDLTNNGSLQAGGTCGRINVAGISRNNGGAFSAVGTNDVQLDICDPSATHAPPEYGFDIQYGNNFGSNISYCTCVPTILPVTLVSFKASVQGSNIILDWITSREFGNSHFEIERSDGASPFQRIGEVYSKNTSAGNTTTTYQFVDKEVSQGYWYYRIKQVDITQAFTYSPVVEVHQPLNTQVFWVKEGNTITRMYPIQSDQQLHLIIYNQIGQQVASFVVDSLTNAVELPSIPEGIYILHTFDGVKTYIQRLIY